MANVKGSQLLGVVKALRKLRPVAGFDVPPHVQPYFSERLIVGAWYPETDLRDLVLMLGHVLSGHVEGDPWRYIGRSGAERDFQGIYAAMVRQGDTEWTVRQMPRGWTQFRDNGKLTLHELESGIAKLELSNYVVMCPEIAKVNAGYFEGTIAASGAKNPEAKVVDSDATSARYLLTWTV